MNCVLTIEIFTINIIITDSTINSTTFSTKLQDVSNSFFGIPPI